MYQTIYPRQFTCRSRAWGNWCSWRSCRDTVLCSLPSQWHPGYSESYYLKEERQKVNRGEWLEHRYNQLLPRVVAKALLTKDTYLSWWRWPPRPETGPQSDCWRSGCPPAWLWHGLWFQYLEKKKKNEHHKRRRLVCTYLVDFEKQANLQRSRQKCDSCEVLDDC